ncbi:MAG: hypothetical protein E7Z91_00810 [Cyanobacteria bacterium SIG30]|nr:hypothetical protein [Cyanobacteria bacterium SIG30]
MYNTAINPLNIVYRKPQQSQGASKSMAQNEEETKNPLEKRRENANHEIDLNKQRTPLPITNASNTVNIAQIITDFKNTNTAINAPKEIQDEIDIYLSLVEKESLKEDPQKSIILSNLKNASKLSDKYITDTLKKPSKVVEGWIDALFAQNVVLKSDPTQINEVFQIKFPDKKVEEQEKPKEDVVEKNVENNIDKKTENKAILAFKQSHEYYKNATPELKNTFAKAKKISKQNPADALKYYENALKMTDSEENIAFKGAIHFERGKIFDEYDYIPNALNEYKEATNSPDENLKSRAHLKIAKIYDENVEYEPALNHYHQAIAYFGEANNPKGQTIAIKELSGMFAQRYDKENTIIFSNLAIDSAKECDDEKTLGEALSDIARNYEYIGENKEALTYYKKAAKTFSANEESLAQVAQNYLDASKLMRKLGNETKANSLLSKAHQYFELTQRNQYS